MSKEGTYNFNFYNVYDGWMDSECVKLCDILGSLPGIETTESCCGHGRGPFRIFFRSSDWRGITFLARCMDKRYWEYGDKWRVELYNSDAAEPGHILFCLTNNETVMTLEEVNTQVQSLIDNMNYHLNHKNYMNWMFLDFPEGWKGVGVRERMCDCGENEECGKCCFTEKKLGGEHD